MDQDKKNILKNLTILYIEDEIKIRENLTKALTFLFQDVIACSTAEEATLIFYDQKIDIILSDINLPHMSGIEFIQNIRSHDNSIPIIMLTAHMDTSYLLDATKLKLTDYLIKPIDFEMLHKAFEKALEEILLLGRYEINFPNETRYNMQKKLLLQNNQNTSLSLSHKEIEVLEYFIHHKDRVVSAEELKCNLWEDEFEATDSALKNVLNKLRKKIGKESIMNISGVGYRLMLT